MEMLRNPIMLFHSTSGYFSFVVGDMRAHASPIISSCLIVANRFSELDRNCWSETFSRYVSISAMASKTCRTRNSSLRGCFIDQDIIFFNIGKHVLGNAITRHHIYFIMQEVLEFSLVAENFHSNWFGIIQFQ